MLHILIRYSFTYSVCTSPTLNGSSVLQLFEHGNTVEIRHGIMFDFYLGLPLMILVSLESSFHALLEYHSC